MRPEELLTYPSWERYTVLSRVIQALSIKDRRCIFNAMRSAPEYDVNVFFPDYGFTLGEFAVWYILFDSKSRRNKLLSDPHGTFTAQQ